MSKLAFFNVRRKMSEIFTFAKENSGVAREFHLRVDRAFSQNFSIAFWVSFMSNLSINFWQLQTLLRSWARLSLHLFTKGRGRSGRLQLYSNFCKHLSVWKKSLTFDISRETFSFCISRLQKDNPNQNALQGSRGAQVPKVQQVGLRRRGEGGRRSQVPQSLLQVLWVSNERFKVKMGKYISFRGFVMRKKHSCAERPPTS